MPCQTLSLTSVKHVALLGLLGFATVFLFGPILAVLAVVLMFALKIGFFVLIGYGVFAVSRRLHLGRHAAWGAVRDGSKAVGRFLARVARLPIRATKAVFDLARATVRKTWGGAKLMGEVSLLSLAGVASGAAFGAILAWQHPDMDRAVAMNAAAGGAIAGLAGLIMTVVERTDRKRDHEAEALPSAEG